ncbi:MAG: flagellar biosynthesis regulator FlaF [Pseudomonadota bacterium]
MSSNLGNQHNQGYTPTKEDAAVTVTQYKTAVFNNQDPLVVEQQALKWVNDKLGMAKGAGANSIQMITALHENRELWLCLMHDVASDDNGLSKELKANIASLALWVYQHSARVLDDEADVEDLIHVNSLIAEGLRQAMENRAAQAPGASKAAQGDPSATPGRISSEV